MLPSKSKPPYEGGSDDKGKGGGGEDGGDRRKLLSYAENMIWRRVLAPSGDSSSCSYVSSLWHLRRPKFSSPNYAPKFIPSSDQSTSSSVTETSNIINIGNLILQDADENKDSMFTCRAKITKIVTREGWYYFGCPICRVKLQMGSDSVLNKFPNHGEQAGKPMYKMQIRLEDEDDSTLAMLMGKPAEILFRKPCSQLIDEGSTEKTVIPKIILDTMHIYKVWKIGFGTRKDFMVRGVYPDTEKVGQEIEEPKTSGKLPLKRKSWSPKESTLHQLLESAKKTKREAGGSSKDTAKPD